MSEEFEIKVRESRHVNCTCEACEARRERLFDYFIGETTDRGIIPGSFTRGEPTTYKVDGRRIMGADLILQAS